MAYNGFLQIGGIPGESTDTKHAGWIEIISYSHDVSQPAGSATSRVGGRTGARVNVGDFRITKIVDKSSPQLHLHCCSGKHIPKVQVELWEAAGEEPHMYMRYTMTDVIISSVRPRGVANEEAYARAIEEVAFNFGTIEWGYSSMAHGGKGEAEIITGWSLEQNAPL